MKPLLVDTGAKKVLVTCAHVLTGYRTRRQRNHRLKLAILIGTGRPVHLSHEPLHVDEELDLAVWDMETMLPEFTHRQFFRLNHQDIPPLKPKAVLATIGYMGKGRGRQVSTRGANFAYNFCGMSVSDTSGP